MRFSHSAQTASNKHDRALGVATTLALAIGLSLAAGLTTAPRAFADDKPLALVGGKPILESDMKLGEAELGQRLAQVPPAARRRILLDYLINSQIYSDAAEAAKLATGPDFDASMRYWRRQTLRNMFFEKTVKASVTEEDAKKYYEEQVKAFPQQDEVKAAHILVKDEAKAKELADKLAKGGDFAALAKEFSEDPGSKDNGGDLGYFSKGQMVPEFEAAAFSLEKGKISAPIKSKFGYHIIRVDDKRPMQPPSFDSVKDEFVNALIQKKAQELGGQLRTAAKIEYLDPDIKAAVEKEKAPVVVAPAPAPAKPAPAKK